MLEIIKNKQFTQRNPNTKSDWSIVPLAALQPGDAVPLPKDFGKESSLRSSVVHWGVNLGVKLLIRKEAGVLYVLRVA